MRRCDLLLVLDNCEHLLDACARLVDALLRACPGLRVLATSREALGITGELAWRVPSLPVLTEHNAPTVAQVCQRLDGIPLALELAAVRIEALTVAQLAARLDQRFRLLTGGSRTALPRQQTLRATLDWSYALLSEPERCLLSRLSVFAGGLTLEAAEAVCAGDGIQTEDVFELLMRLVRKSLVVAEEGRAGSVRYRLLETLRQYADEHLMAAGDAQAVGERHASYYLALAEEVGPSMYEWAVDAVDRLLTEHDNLRAAARWFSDSNAVEQAVRLGGQAQDDPWIVSKHTFWESNGQVTRHIRIA